MLIKFNLSQHNQMGNIQATKLYGYNACNYVTEPFEGACSAPRESFRGTLVLGERKESEGERREGRERKGK